MVARISRKASNAPSISLRALQAAYANGASSNSIATLSSRSFQQVRPLSSSRTHLATFRPSQTALYPRWINKDDQTASAKNDNVQEEAEDAVEESQEAAAVEQKDSKSAITPESVKAMIEDRIVQLSSSSSKASSSASSGGASAPPAASSSGNGDGKGSGSNKPAAPQITTDVAKQTIPEVYPQVLALPITRRPLFPGFYKAVVIRDKAVVAAIKEMVKRGQPYLAAFLLKNDDSETDIITDIDSVHPVGVFAQITSTFTNPSPSNGKSKEKGQAEDDGDLTVVLYPHRRIKITELLPPSPKAKAQPLHSIQAQAESDGVIGSAPSTPPPAYSQASSSTEAKTSTEDPEAVTSFEKESEQASSSEDSASSDAPNPLQTSFLQDYAVSRVNVENLIPSPAKKITVNQTTRAVSSEIISVFKDIATLNPLFRDQIANFSMSQGAHNVFEDPEKLADFAAAVSTGEPVELQDVLNSVVIEDRLQKSLLVLKKELMNAQLQSKISKDVESKIQKRQREYYLMEQLKGIKRELGIESDGKDKMIEKFMETAKTLNMPEAVRKVFDEEITKLQHLEPAASEFNVTRNYLDWITQIPWGRHSEENFSLTHARVVLDEDHFGLKDVKNRILEFLAVGKLRGTVQGKILCFVGPPGVGKTSIGKSIARALNRQFFRFSVGGLADVAEMKGHRRTYVGAMPGKFIQALKKVSTENPLILIDEIDKLGRGHNGDPGSALLEALDPEQNHAYLDHYLDVPVDLSRVLFVCTANSLDTIPAPLLDRMEVLEVSGYVSEEKRAIASRYLGPQAKEASGLKDANVSIADDAIDQLIRYYCRESGVRRLKQQIEKVYRKAALKIVTDLGEDALPEPASAELKSAPTDTAEVQEALVTKADGEPKLAESGPRPEDIQTVEEPKPAEASKPTEERNTTTKVRQPMSVPSSVNVTITKDNLTEYVGPPTYQRDRIYTQTTPAGVSTGLGYLGNGSGSCLPIEVTIMPGTGITLTGKLGEVIRESAQIALSFLRANAFTLGLVQNETDDLLKDKAIHLHMPEGGIGKEGPSAGTAILTALVSLFLKKGISSELAMTGEITLAGQVLAVGGVQEKLLAAQRAGIKTVIVPSACRSDIEHNVSASVKEGMEIVYAEDVRDVLRRVFAKEALVQNLDKLPVASQVEQ